VDSPTFTFGTNLDLGLPDVCFACFRFVTDGSQTVMTDMSQCSTVVYCLHCCEGDQLNLWRMTKSGYQNYETPEPTVTRKKNGGRPLFKTFLTSTVVFW